MLRELNTNEMEQTSGGCPQCIGVGAVAGAAGSGAVVGTGLALAAELSDDRPGVSAGNLLIGAAAGVGGGISALFTANMAGPLAFGIIGQRAIDVNNDFRDKKYEDKMNRLHSEPNQTLSD